MDFKERIMTAMNHEEPDRVPVMGMTVDPATVNQIMGNNPVDLVSLLRKPVLRNIIKALMNTNWFWNRFYYGNTAGTLESAIKLGFDANWTTYSLMQLNEDHGAPLGLVWHDVCGRVWELGQADDGSMTLHSLAIALPSARGRNEAEVDGRRSPQVWQIPDSHIEVQRPCHEQRDNDPPNMQLRNV